MTNNNIEEQILAGDKTILDVFAEKSKDADDAIEYGMGLSPEELMDIAMSVTPMGGVKAGKDAVSFLKGLLGRAKSKAKFPVGYGEPTRNFTNYLQQHEKNISGLQKSQKNIQKLLKEYEALEKPKGIRQFGKFNRQKWEK